MKKKQIDTYFDKMVSILEEVTGEKQSPLTEEKVKCIENALIEENYNLAVPEISNYSFEHTAIFNFMKAGEKNMHCEVPFIFFGRIILFHAELPDITALFKYSALLSLNISDTNELHHALKASNILTFPEPSIHHPIPIHIMASSHEIRMRIDFHMRIRNILEKSIYKSKTQMFTAQLIREEASNEVFMHYQEELKEFIIQALKEIWQQVIIEKRKENT